MEDRYLFKAKRADNGEWVQGYLFDDGFENGRMFVGGLVIEEYHGTACDDWSITGINFCEVDPSTICQCTGLKDKNGKLIWENDVVGYYDKYVGKWFYGLVGYGEFNCSCCSGVYGWHFGDEDIREYKGYEVKGNIFDNKELLESEEK